VRVSSDLTPRRAGVDPVVPAAGRSNRRYPVQLDLRYQVLRGGKPLRGIGVTREFSSTEVKFAADQDLPLGALIELSLAWPQRLDGVCPLQLMVFGKIAAIDEKGTILTISRYEFRTPSLRTAHVEPRRIDAQMESARRSLVDRRLGQVR
jgi:hypothetical protein